MLRRMMTRMQMAALMTALILGQVAVSTGGARLQRRGNGTSHGAFRTAIPAHSQVSPMENTAHCSGGSGSTVCPRRGDNYISAGGGGSCKFRYTWHDGQGSGQGSPVVTSGSCTITEDDLASGSETNVRGRDWVRSLALHDGFTQDDAGHILANNLGGCGTCPINLFPQNLNINRGAYRIMEAAIANCVAQGGVTAQLAWSFRYKSPALPHLRVDTYTYSATFSGGSCQSMSQSFDNPQWVSR